MLTLLYNLLLTVVVPIFSPLFLLHPRARERMRERFGIWNLPKGEYVWIHGASAGELNGLVKFIPWLRQQFPKSKILVTSFSVNGVKAHGDKGDFAKVIPFDIRWLLERVLRELDLKLFLFGETELWPSLLGVLNRKKTPMFLINGRIEDSSFRYYSIFRSCFQGSLPSLTGATVTSELSQKRLTSLGVPIERVMVLGNTKYDSEPRYDIGGDSETLEKLSGVFGSGRRIVTLGSIHPGEIDHWAEALSRFGKESRPLTIVAPRHIEKIAQFEEVLKSRGLQFVHLSQLDWSKAFDGSVLIVDEFGQLEKYYSISDLAFIGGTLIPLGGHNPFEPAPYSVPICMGPNRRKIPEEALLISQQEACFDISGAGEIRKIVSLSAEELSKRGKALNALWNRSRGSFESVKGFLKERL